MLCSSCAVKAKASDKSCGKFGTDVTKEVCRIYVREEDVPPPKTLNRQKVMKLASTYGYITQNGYKKFTEAALMEFCEALLRDKENLVEAAGHSDTLADAGIRGSNRGSERAS